MMRVSVTYFAILREQRGLAQETLGAEGKTLRDLFRHLRARHGFSLDETRVRVALNEQFADWDAPVPDGGRVAFLPPASGG